VNWLIIKLQINCELAITHFYTFHLKSESYYIIHH